MFLPHIRHFPSDVMTGTVTANGTSSQSGANSPSSFDQSGLLLAEGYGESLDPALLKVDSFYATSELFHHSASSICQLLNVIQSIIDDCIGYKLSKSPSHSLANLAYHLDILNRLEMGFARISSLSRVMRAQSGQKAMKTSRVERPMRRRPSIQSWLF
jgi:hypothetical protein